jgi:ABC-2 type transport system permease protein
VNLGHQVRAEIRKLFATKLWLWLLLGAMAFAALATIITLAADGSDGNPNPPVGTDPGIRNLFSAIGAGSILAIVLGAIGMTGEYRHLTVTPTFLASPQRGRVVVAKLITYLLAGIAYGIACTVVVFAIALPWLSSKGIHLHSGQGIPKVVGGAIAAIAVYALLGVGVGALVRNQIAAVVGTLVYLFVLENLISAIPHVKDYYRWFPGAAAQALSGSVSSAGLLHQWQGGLLVAGYALAFAILGRFIAIRRDVT